MKKTYIINILFIFLSINVYSQNNDIKKIRERYKSIINEDITYHELKFNSVLPAIGPKHTAIKFYYESRQKNPEEDPYEMDSRIIKIEIKYNISAHSHYLVEYLFDNKEQLIFYFDKVEGMFDNYEKRYYFKDKKLIRSMIKNMNEDGKLILNKSKLEFSEEDHKNADKGIIKANSYKKI